MYRHISSVVIKLYENMVDRRYQKYWDPEVLESIDLAAYFVIEIESASYGYEKDGNTHHKEWVHTAQRFVHVVLHKHHRVYVAITKDSRLSAQSLLNLNKFKNLGNHDSCYRDSLESELSKLYFDVYQEAWQNIPQEHQKIPADSVQVSLQTLFRDVVQFVTITRARIDDAKESLDGYLDQLTSIKPLKVKFNLVESKELRK